MTANALGTVALWLMAKVLFLCVMFQVKHLLCDYWVQGRFRNGYMLRKVNVQGWLAPIITHAVCHGLGTFAIAVLTLPEQSRWLLLAAMLGTLDTWLHGGIDRIKGDTTRHLTPDQPWYWTAMGLDQMAHHLTHYVLIALIMYVNIDWLLR